MLTLTCLNCESSISCVASLIVLNIQLNLQPKVLRQHLAISIPVWAFHPLRLRHTFLVFASTEARSTIGAISHLRFSRLQCHHGDIGGGSHERWEAGTAHDAERETRKLPGEECFGVSEVSNSTAILGFHHPQEPPPPPVKKQECNFITGLCHDWHSDHLDHL